MADQLDQVGDDEILYRRIPSHWYNSLTDPKLPAMAFRPHKTADPDGLSLERARYKTAEEAAVGRPGKAYHVAAVRAGDLRDLGLTMSVTDHNNPSHVVIPELNSGDYKGDRTIELAQIIADQLATPVLDRTPSS